MFEYWFIDCVFVVDFALGFGFVWVYLFLVYCWVVVCIWLGLCFEFV